MPGDSYQGAVRGENLEVKVQAKVQVKVHSRAINLQDSSKNSPSPFRNPCPNPMQARVAQLEGDPDSLHLKCQWN